MQNLILENVLIGISLLFVKKMSFKSKNVVTVLLRYMG